MKLPTIIGGCWPWQGEMFMSFSKLKGSEPEHPDPGCLLFYFFSFSFSSFIKHFQHSLSKDLSQWEQTGSEILPD